MLLHLCCVTVKHQSLVLCIYLKKQEGELIETLSLWLPSCVHINAAVQVLKSGEVVHVKRTPQKETQQVSHDRKPPGIVPSDSCIHMNPAISSLILVLFAWL